MRVLWVVALFVTLSMSFSGGQQAVTSGLPPVPDVQPARVKVYSVGPGVTAPKLLPLNLAPISDEQCKMKVGGKVVLSVLVDTTGQLHNIMFLKPLGTDLDRFALKIVSADRFIPGTHEGVPVVVGQSVEVDLQACVDEKKDNAGKKIYSLRLRSQPVQKLTLSHSRWRMLFLHRSVYPWRIPTKGLFLTTASVAKSVLPLFCTLPKRSSLTMHDAQTTAEYASSR